MEGIDKDTFKKIFRDHWDEYKTVYPRYNSDYYDNVIRKMLDCGDPDKMGYARYWCCCCGESRKIAFSCKSCFCLTCAKGYTDKWSDFIGRRLIPQVIYRHEVLTVPDFLRIYFYRNPHLLNNLMQIGNNCLIDILQTCVRTNLKMGTIIVLQTHGRSGRYNPHLHILFTAGGIDPKGQWKPVSYIPYKLMHRKWQYHLLTMLAKEIDKAKIKKDINHGWKGYPKGFVAFLQDGDVPAGGQGLAKYLAKYVTSPPISVRRIESYDQKTVSYWYRDHKTKAIQHETVPALIFIGRMVQHILPKGFQRIRYYGLHANACYAKDREYLRVILKSDKSSADPNGYRVLPRLPFAQLFEKAFGKDPLACPKCGDTMQLELIYHPKYGIIKEFIVFKELPDERFSTKPAIPHGGPVDRAQRMVQLPLPFM